MKVLLVAPKLCSPWSEGRKKFVCDLIEASAGRWETSCLSTYDEPEGPARLDCAEHSALSARYSYQHLTRLVFELGKTIDRADPDLVCYFPFGAFGGLRSLANILFLQHFLRICRRRDVPHMALMYSLTQEADNSWHQWALRDTWQNQYSGHDKTIRFGVRLPTAPSREPRAEPQRLLFMAGMAEHSAERLDYALNVRGLGLLLDCGTALGEAGFTLTVAIPFLRDPALLDSLRARAKAWGDRVRFEAIARTPDIYAEHDIFVFPYAREEVQFVPTSVVEAMHCGLPVVLPRLRFLRPFHGGEQRVKDYEPGDGDSLAQAVIALSKSGLELTSQVDRARAFIDSEYDISASVADIERSAELLRLKRDPCIR